MEDMLNLNVLTEEVKEWEMQAENRSLSEEERVRWMEARKKWPEKEDWKNQMIRQKTRVKWVIEGNENSAFFHSVIKKKNGKNNLRGLMIDWIWCEHPQKIKVSTFEFYKRLFEENVPRRPKLHDGLFKTLNQDDRNMLEALILEEDVWKSIKECGSKKSPGPDGFNFGFIKKFWLLLKTELMTAINYFWETGKISKG